MKLCKLVLRYKNVYGIEKQKEVKFNDKLTLITGSSKKGKSAIIELVDYVLFSSSNIIPAGVIKDHLDVVILVLEIKREVVSLIRDTETGNMQLISGEFTSNTKINKTKYLKKDIIQDKFEKKLNLYTIDYIKKGSMDQEVVKKYSLRYQVPYNILAQNIIANKDVVFRNFADYKYKKPMKDYFDVYMGIDTPENKYHKLEMTRLEKELKSIEQEIDERNQEYLKRETSILRQLNSLRLSKGLKPLMSTTEVEQEDILLSEKESNFLEKLDDNQLEIELNNLKESKKELIDKKNRLTIENSEIKKFNENFSKREKEKINISIEQCPLCNQHSNNLNVLLKEYNASVKKYNSLSDNLATFQENESVQILEKNQHDIYVLDKKLHDVSSEIDRIQNVLYSNADSNFWREYYKVKSQIPSFNNEKKLEKIASIKEEIARHKELYKRTNKSEFFSVLNNNLTDIVRMFDIEDEFKTKKLRFDSDDFYLYFGNGKQDGIGLANTGSGANWEAMHLALNIGIIKTALEVNPAKTSIFPFLFVDQPTQVYFSSYDETIQRDTKDSFDFENEAVIKLFKSLTNVCESAGIQLVILEHIKPEHFESLDSNLYKVLNDAKTEDWHESESALLELN